MRVKQITSRDPAQNVLMNCQYTYDKMDNIITKDTEHGMYTYGYDALYRLTSADNPTLPDEAYTYDGVGNRLTSSDATDWTYNANNELQGYDGITFAYDNNGNTVQKTEGTETTYYIYNEEDRLSRVEDTAHNTIATYYYDPFGRRLWKEVAGNRTYFLYSDEGLIGEYDADGTELKTYGYKPNSTWTTDPLFLEAQGQYYFYINDHLGTPQKMSAVNGSILWSANFNSFGEANVRVEAIEANFRFPGQYLDYETGFHYNYNRYYKPIQGRYARLDPLRIADSNPYIYTRANPIIWSDSLGLYVGGFGLTGTASKAILSKLGLSGSYSALLVFDDKGNSGIAVCGNAGASINTGFVVGFQTSHLWGIKSVCDLEGSNSQLGLGGGYAKGPGIAADICPTGMNILTGVGAGKWGAAINLLGGCKLIKVAIPCEDDCEKKIYYGIGQGKMKTTYRREVLSS